jgi:hypothetical protein
MTPHVMYLGLYGYIQVTNQRVLCNELSSRIDWSTEELIRQRWQNVMVKLAIWRGTRQRKCCRARSTQQQIQIFDSKPLKWQQTEQTFTLWERTPAGGVNGDAGPKPRGRHRAVQRQERLQPRRQRGRRTAPKPNHQRERTRRIPSGSIARESVGYLRRIRADRAAEGEARGGSGAPRTRPVTGAERAADLTATATAAAVRDKDAISSSPVFSRRVRWRCVVGAEAKPRGVVEAKP